MRAWSSGQLCSALYATTLMARKVPLQPLCLSQAEATVLDGLLQQEPGRAQQGCFGAKKGGACDCGSLRCGTCGYRL